MSNVPPQTAATAPRVLALAAALQLVSSALYVSVYWGRHLFNWWEGLLAGSWLAYAGLALAASRVPPPLGRWAVTVGLLVCLCLTSHFLDGLPPLAEILRDGRLVQIPLLGLLLWAVWSAIRAESLRKGRPIPGARTLIKLSICALAIFVSAVIVAAANFDLAIWLRLTDVKGLSARARVDCALSSACAFLLAVCIWWFWSLRTKVAGRGAGKEPQAEQCNGIPSDEVSDKGSDTGRLDAAFQRPTD